MCINIKQSIYYIIKTRVTNYIKELTKCLKIIYLKLKFKMNLIKMKEILLQTFILKILEIEIVTLVCEI